MTNESSTIFAENASLKIVFFRHEMPTRLSGDNRIFKFFSRANVMRNNPATLISYQTLLPVFFGYTHCNRFRSDDYIFFHNVINLTELLVWTDEINLMCEHAKKCRTQAGG